MAEVVYTIRLFAQKSGKDDDFEKIPHANDRSQPPQVKQNTNYLNTNCK